MDKNRELAKNTIIITIGKICTQFASFLLLPFYTALLTTEQYGAVDLVTTYVQLLLPVVFFQIDQAVFRFLIDKRGNKDDEGTLISSLFVFVIGQCLVFSLIYFIVNLLFTIPYSWLFFANVIASISSSCTLQIARGLGDNTCYALGSFISGFFNILLNVVFIAALGMRADGMMLAMAVGNILCVLFIATRKKLYGYIRISNYSTDAIKEMTRYSIPLIPNALSWWVVNASDRSIVLMFLGASANGILAASHKFSTIITTFYGIFNISWTESAALHLKESDGDEFFSNTVDTMYRLFVSCCIGIIAFMPFLFPIMINQAYSDAYVQIPIYMYAAVFNIVAGLYSVVYIANKRTGEIAKTSVMAGVINIVIDYVLIRWIGLYAASISSAIAYAAMAIYRHIDVKKYVRLRSNNVSIISSIAVTIIVSIAYYTESKFFQVIGAIISVAYAILINWKLIKKTVEIFIGKFIQR